MRRILAAVDGSEGSMRAVELAVDLATKFRAELTLVDVVEHGEPPHWALAEYVRVDLMQLSSGRAGTVGSPVCCSEASRKRFAASLRAP